MRRASKVVSWVARGIVVWHSRSSHFTGVTQMKIVIVTAILALTAVSGWTQGTVDFRNGGITFPTDTDRRVYLWTGVPLTGTTWVAGVWHLPGADRGAQIGTATQVGRTFAFRSDPTA